MSIRIKDVPPKVGQVSNSTKMATEDALDDTNKTRQVSLSDVTPYTWASSDEDSALALGILYTTESAAVRRSLLDVVVSLKNAPTGTDIEVDILKETGINTNVFATIFSTRPIVMITEFTSLTALPAAVVSDTIWEEGRRLQIQLTINDSNFAATGLKVSIKS